MNDFRNLGLLYRRIKDMDVDFYRCHTAYRTARVRFPLMSVDENESHAKLLLSRLWEKVGQDKRNNHVLFSKDKRDKIQNRVLFAINTEYGVLAISYIDCHITIGIGVEECPW